MKAECYEILFKEWKAKANARDEQNAELLAALKYATEELNELKMGTRYRAQTGYVIMRCEAAIAQAERANT